ncbi:MAG: hypothetical protein LUD40_13410 [Phocaeicola dorei]|nr:hypothetical protein [Phocaeicola dorei]
MSRISKYLLIALFLLCGIVYIQHKKAVHLAEERDRYQQNSNALLSEVKRMQLDSTTMALDVHGLKLTVDEYKKFRAEDAEKIRQMGVKLKNLEATARHEVSVDAPINAVVRDTVIIRDSNQVRAQRIEMRTPYIQMSGMIENNILQGHIHVPVTLRQAIWIEYKRTWIFWKKVKAVHQTISSDNPYVEIKYSEFINLTR